MSLEGIRKIARVLSVMQETRIELLGSKNNQDIRLGQMLEDGRRSMDERFIAETLLASEIDMKTGLSKGE